MPALNHIHEYVRSRSNKNIYRCNHPQCSHFTSRELAEGKLALCTQCKNEFILTWDQLKNRAPRCLNCSKSKKAQSHRASKSFVDDIVSAAREIEESTRQ